MSVEKTYTPLRMIILINNLDKKSQSQVVNWHFVCSTNDLNQKFVLTKWMSTKTLFSYNFYTLTYMQHCISSGQRDFTREFVHSVETRWVHCIKVKSVTSMVDKRSLRMHVIFIKLLVCSCANVSHVSFGDVLCLLRIRTAEQLSFKSPCECSQSQLLLGSRRSR